MTIEQLLTRSYTIRQISEPDGDYYRLSFEFASRDPDALLDILISLRKEAGLPVASPGCLAIIPWKMGPGFWSPPSQV